MRFPRTIAPALALLFALVAGLRAQSIPRGVYVGKVGDRQEILMAIVDEDSTWIGSWFYTAQGYDVDLGGSVAANRFRIVEQTYDRARPGATVSGMLRGDTLAGQWIAGDGRKKGRFTAARAASLERVERLDESGVYYAATWPRFLPRLGRWTAALNDSIAHTVAEWTNMTVEELNDQRARLAEAGTGYANGVEEEHDLDVRYCSADLIGIEVTAAITRRGRTRYDFASMNFAMKGGEARRIHVADLFKPGAAYAPLLARLIHAELRRAEYPCIADVAETDLEEDDVLDLFVVTATGLRYRLWPAAYSCGPAENIVIPWRELRGMIDPKGPLARLARK